MAIGFEIARATGSNRRSSEDRASVFTHGGTLVVVVADGAGGMPGGAAASDAVIVAVQTMVEQRAFDAYDLAGWLARLERVDEELARGAVGESTAVVVVIGRRGILGVSAGDSEAWMMSASIDGLTDDQHRTRLGSGRARLTPFHRRGLEGPLVVGTDGLFKHTAPERIAASCIQGNAAAVAQRLVTLPMLPSGTYPDDVALVVVDA